MLVFEEKQTDLGKIVKHTVENTETQAFSCSGAIQVRNFNTGRWDNECCSKDFYLVSYLFIWYYSDTKMLLIF